MMENNTTNIFSIEDTYNNCIKLPLEKEISKNTFFHDSDHSVSKSSCQKGWTLPAAKYIRQYRDVHMDLFKEFYGLLTLIIVTIAPFSVILLPMHVALFNQQYWYEIFLSTSCIYIWFASSSAIEFKTLFGDHISSILNIRIM